MTQNPDVSPDRSAAVPGTGVPGTGMPDGGAHAAKGGSRFRGKAWLLLCLPVGLTTFAAFLYIGIRARRRRWLVWAGVYAATLAGWLVLDAPAAEVASELILTGRTSTLPCRAEGIFDATWIASFRSRASIM